MKTRLSIATVILVPMLALAGCTSRKAEIPSAQNPVEQLIVWGDAEPDSGEAPLEVELFVDPLEDIDSPEYSWDPGDGSDKVAGQKVKHTYARPGTYKARVTVTDADGNRGEDEVLIDVEVAE
jgi:hypothetical protein